MPFGDVILGDAVRARAARGEIAPLLESARTFPQEAFATKEQVRFAHELRLQLREYLLRRPSPPLQPWSVGVD